jgi:hypothetical protein
MITDEGLLITPLGMDVPEWGPTAIPLHPRAMEKIASGIYIPDRLLEFMDQVRPRDDGRYVLLHAIGAGEYWGCFLPGSPVLTESGRYLPIEKISKGMRVMGRSGLFREVLTTWEYRHHRSGVRISVEGLVDDIGTTPNHEFLSLSHEEILCARDRTARCIPETQGAQGICKRPQSVACAKKPRILTGKWRRADSLALKDFLLCSIPKHDAPAIFTEAEARVVGLWVADGNFVSNGGSVDLEFSVSDSEAYLIDDLRALGSPQVYRGHGACKSVRLRNHELVSRIYRLFGEYSHGKRIPGDFARQPENVILAFLSGYFDGDGSQNLKDGSAYAHTVSKDLALGVQRLLWSVRIPSTVCPAPKAYHVHFSLSRGRSLAEKCRKFRRHAPKGRPRYRQFFIDDYVCLPIRKMERFEIDGPVYDLEVEEEHTYNVAQVVCHNSNKNSDYFPEWSLKGEEMPPDVKEYIREHRLPIPIEYGHKTFERYGYPYFHHNNHDPIHSIGERVCCSAYNDRMHRVELIVFILKRKAPDVIRRIDRGEPVPWSMGAKLPFDVCVVCRHPARKRSDYCEHLRSMLGRILPDGQRVFSLNYFPRFFDISVVSVPADRSAYSLKKVASYLQEGKARVVWTPGMDHASVEPVPVGGSEEMEKFAGMLDYLASGGEKSADIEKEVPAQEPAKDLGESPIHPDLWKVLYDMAAKDRAGTPEMEGGLLSSLRSEPLRKALTALTSLGIMLKPREADSLIGDQEMPDGLDEEEPSSKLLDELTGLVPERSMVEPHFSIRIIRIRRPDSSPSDIVKEGGAYDRYLKWLRSIDLEKFAELAERPEVEAAMAGKALKEKSLNFLDKTAGRDFGPFLPFVAAMMVESDLRPTP